MRFFRDDDMEIPVSWYFCAPGAKVFTDYTRFRSGNWAAEKYDWDGPGEVIGPRPWRDGSPPPLPEALLEDDTLWPPQMYCQITRIEGASPFTLPYLVGEIFPMRPYSTLQSLQRTDYFFPALGPRGIGFNIYFGAFFPAAPPRYITYMWVGFGLTTFNVAIPVINQSLTAGQHSAGPASAFADGAYPGSPGLGTSPSGACIDCGGPVWEVSDVYIPALWYGNSDLNVVMDFRFFWNVNDRLPL